MEAFAVFLGGGIGAGLRYLFSVWADKKFKITYWATFIVNISGCLFLGFAAACYGQKLNADFYLFLTTGIAGGFTTFSTFSNENIELLREGKIYISLLYIFLSLTVGLAAVYVGFLLAGILKLN